MLSREGGQLISCITMYHQGGGVRKFLKIVINGRALKFPEPRIKLGSFLFLYTI